MVLKISEFTALTVSEDNLCGSSENNTEREELRADSVDDQVTETDPGVDGECEAGLWPDTLVFWREKSPNSDKGLGIILSVFSVEKGLRFECS